MSEKSRLYKDFVFDCYLSNRKQVILAGFLIDIFELIFAIYKIIFFNNSPRSIVYLILYISLFVVTTAAIIVALIAKNSKYKVECLNYIFHIYHILIIVWACGISLLDVSKSNYPIVFITVIFSLPYFIVINPFQSTAGIIVGSSLIFIQQYVVEGGLSSGQILNFIVVIVMAILATVLSYNHYRKKFLLSTKLKRDSLSDGLTGLFNRSAMDNKLEQLGKDENLSTVIMIDIDNFKPLNDTLGHRYGDKALIIIANLLKDNFGKYCYRYGGDEFLVVTTLNNLSIQKHLTSINEELVKFSDKVKLSISSGIYNVVTGDSEIDIIKNADSALYEAKKNKGSFSININKNI